MVASAFNENNSRFFLRLTARGLSIVSIAAILLFFFGAGGEIAGAPWIEIAAFIFFPLGVFAGLVLAWEEEIKGGWLALISLTAFYILYNYAFAGSIRETWWIAAIALPGLLFVLHGYLTGQVKEPQNGQHGPHGRPTA